jgi:hypothetical protein
VDIGFQVNYFSTTTSQVWVNNNGNITFGSALTAFTPSPLGTLGQQIIAPFWADVDTRSAGSAMTQYGQGTVDGHAAFAVTWNGVDYFNATSSTHQSLSNFFQLVLIDRSDTGAGNFDIEFNYGPINWETGDASGGHNGTGGTSARVGYANVDGTTYEFPGSNTPGSFLDGGPQALSSNSNDGTPGQYLFAARGGNVVGVNPGSVSIDNGTENGTPVGVTANFSSTYKVHDPNNPGPWPGGATIDWGDAAPGAPPDQTTVASGDIHFVSQGTTSSEWQITGPSATHLYQEGGRYPIRVHVDAGGGVGADTSGTADVTDPALAVTNKADLSTGFTEGGDPFTGPLFTISDPNEQGTLGPGNYTVQINWGDGTPVETIDPGAGDNPSLTVTAAPHTFMKAGDLNVQITVIDNRDGHTTKNQVTDTISANVADAQLDHGSTIHDLVGTAGQPPTTQFHAIFHDPDANAKPSDFNVSITWHDGSTDTVTPTPNGTLTGYWNIDASHVYANPGDFPIDVVVTDKDRTSPVNQVMIHGSAHIAQAPPPPSGGGSQPGNATADQLINSAFSAAIQLLRGAAPVLRQIKRFRGIINRIQGQLQVLVALTDPALIQVFNTGTALFNQITPGLKQKIIKHLKVEIIAEISLLASTFLGD